MRSSLTMLGIIIGVGAVISTVAIGQGAGAQMQSDISSLGANMLMVFPGSANTGGLETGMGKTRTLTSEDEKAILNECPSVSAVAGGVETSTQLVWNTTNWFAQVTGTEPSFFEVRSWRIAEGMSFTQDDVEGADNVAVIGETTRRKLFGAVDPLGQTIRIKNLPFRVVGVLTAKGSSFGEDQDNLVVVPLTTAQKKLIGTTWLQWIYVAASSQKSSRRAETEITTLMRDRHRIQPDTRDDFSVSNMAEFASAANKLSSTITLLLGSVASVALIVGGIGIMNIMLVSVTERTREIGIRIAIGATELDVQRQFLIEAIVLSVVGGLAGIACGEFASFIIDHFLEWKFSFSPLAISVAVAFSAGIGIVFGYYPARRASQLNPIEALRYE
jgi:putative ABC transport system permease protein